MKKLLAVVLLSIIGITSCEKDEIPDCSCGFIVDDGVEIVNGQTYYWLGIENDCSGNYGKYYFNYSDWITAYVGTNFCVTNVSSWKK